MQRLHFLSSIPSSTTILPLHPLIHTLQTNPLTTHTHTHTHTHMTKLTEDEKQFLKTTAPNGGGSVVLVEYLESTMSKQLLGKFPDNSAFDFDYTQSSIWSPVIPRRHFDFSLQDVGLAELLRKSLFSDSSSSNNIEPTVLQRKLTYNENEQEGFLGKGITTGTVIKKMSDGFKRKISTNVCNNLKICRDMKMMKMKKPKGLVLPTNDSCFGRSTNSPATRKGWSKMLKAASGHFKKTGKKKDYNGVPAHIRLPNNYLGYSNYWLD